MSDRERETLKAELTALIAAYGPWAVLWQVTKLLKPAFKAIEPTTPKQPRKGPK